jgi:hypothetical protein
VDGNHNQHTHIGHFHHIVLQVGTVYLLADDALNDARTMHGMDDFVANLIHTAPPSSGSIHHIFEIYNRYSKKSPQI